MSELLLCGYCSCAARFVDLDFGEGYCRRHWDEQQTSNEPVANWVDVLEEMVT